MSIPFLRGATICIESIPSYEDFHSTFEYELDYPILELLYNSSDPRMNQKIKSSMEALMSNVDVKTGKVNIAHYQTNGISRFYGKNSIIPLSRHIKHTVFQYCNYIDIDMKKAHPSIALSVFETIKKAPKLVGIRFYVENFDRVAAAIRDYHQEDGETNVMDDDYHIKLLFNMMLYGGGFDTWVETCLAGDTKRGIAPIILKNTDILHKYASSYKDDCKELSVFINKSNKPLIKKLKQSGDSPHEIANRVVSYWFGCIENHILYETYLFMVKKEIVAPCRPALEYDGMCFKSLKAFDETEMAETINSVIESKTGLSVKMKFKGYDNKRILWDVIEARKAMTEEQISALTAAVIKQRREEEQEEYENDMSFGGVSRRFELTHAKISNKSIFVKKLDDTISVMSKTNLITSYEHMIYEKVKIYTDKDGNESIEIILSNFINDWLRNNPAQLCYTDIECFPDGIKCPDGVYNTWCPFAMECITEYDPNPDALKLILNHIRVLCGNDDLIAEYFNSWIGQMIQFPAIKSICPTLISKEGAGKGTLLRLLANMLGSNKVFETTTPSRDIWGEFNERMTNTFLINLNELSKKETIESEGEIKALITDPKLTINNKGISKYQINSYHRFIITTNKEEPINTTADDRRKIIIRSSDELCGNKVYFNKLYDLMDDVNVVKTCYEYFKSIKGMDKFNSIPIPIPAYQKELQKLSKNPIELWLESFTLEMADEEEEEIYAAESYKSFKKWCDKNMPKYEINSLAFSVRLARLNISGVREGRHTKKGNTNKFDIALLKKHFEIGCLIDLDAEKKAASEGY